MLHMSSNFMISEVNYWPKETCDDYEKDTLLWPNIDVTSLPTPTSDLMGVGYELAQEYEEPSDYSNDASPNLQNLVVSNDYSNYQYTEPITIPQYAALPQNFHTQNSYMPSSTQQYGQMGLNNSLPIHHHNMQQYSQQYMSQQPQQPLYQVLPTPVPTPQEMAYMQKQMYYQQISSRVMESYIDVRNPHQTAQPYVEDLIIEDPLGLRMGTPGFQVMPEEHVTLETRNMAGEEFEKKSLLDQLKENPGMWEVVSNRNKKGSYKCSHCSEYYSTLMDFATHIDEFKISRPYKCPVGGCPWQIVGLPRRAELRRHCVSQHFLKGKYREDKSINSQAKKIINDLIYTCKEPLCEKTFYRRDSLQRHNRLVHENQDSKFNRKMKKVRARKDKRKNDSRK